MLTHPIPCTPEASCSLARESLLAAPMHLPLLHQVPFGLLCPPQSRLCAVLTTARATSPSAQAGAVSLSCPSHLSPQAGQSSSLPSTTLEKNWSLVFPSHCSERLRNVRTHGRARAFGCRLSLASVRSLPMSPPLCSRKGPRPRRGLGCGLFPPTPRPTPAEPDFSLPPLPPRPLQSPRTLELEGIIEVL